MFEEEEELEKYFAREMRWGCFIEIIEKIWDLRAEEIILEPFEIRDKCLNCDIWKIWRKDWE